MKPNNSGCGPLAGLRVADFTWIGAGAYTTRILADFGAEVIKVESATRLDPLRMTAPFKDGIAGVNRSGYFADRNCNKLAMQLNLKTAEGMSIARKLIERCDIVANNFAPGVMERFGLGYESIASEQPGIIYLSMSMQGATGPESHYVGFGLTIAALSGLLHLSGDPEDMPMGTGTNYPDHIPNPCHAAFAVLAAVRHRRITGEGQYIDLAQTEPTIALLGPAITDYLVNGRVGNREANRHGKFAPHGVYKCRDDRWIAVAVQTESQWDSLSRILDLSGCENPVNLTWLSIRQMAIKDLDALIGRRTLMWDAHRLEKELLENGIAAGVASNIAELINDDAQLAHRHHWVRIAHEEMGPTIYNSLPIRLSRTNDSMERAAPMLGEHTAYVCEELLGYTPEEVAQLQRNGVLN